MENEKGKFVHREGGTPKEKVSAKRTLAMKDAIKALLPKDGSGLTRKEIWERLPEELRKNEVRFKEILSEGEESEWKKNGDRKNGLLRREVGS